MAQEMGLCIRSNEQRQFNPWELRQQAIKPHRCAFTPRWHVPTGRAAWVAQAHGHDGHTAWVVEVRRIDAHPVT